MNVYADIALLAAFALAYVAFARRLERAAFSGALAFVAFGYGVGPAGAGWLDWRADPEVYELLVELTLAAVLFGDAARADFATLRQRYRAALRLLTLSLPLTILCGFALALLVFPVLSPLEAALLATMLAPTDAALGKAVVVDPKVPPAIRTTLNVESGLNDGICVPVLVVLLALAGGAGGEAETVSLVDVAVAEIGVGALVGITLAVVARYGLAWTLAHGWTDAAALAFATPALAFLAFALAQALGGSGFIAAFVAGLVWGWSTRRTPVAGIALDEAVAGLMGYLAWVVFGVVVIGVVAAHLDLGVVLYALASLTLVRMAPVFLTLTGLPYPPADRLFVGWFGPRGLATIVFILMTARAGLPNGDLVTAVAATTVLASVVLHGVSARPLASLYGRPAAEPPPASGE